jgi:hypothetical protein
VVEVQEHRVELEEMVQPILAVAVEVEHIQMLVVQVVQEL